MNLFIPSRLLLIHGGMNTDKITHGASTYYSDISAFDLVNLNWIRVIAYDSKQIERSGHVSEIFGSKLVVFGGVNPSGFIHGRVKFLEFNQKKVSQLYKAKIAGLKVKHSQDLQETK